LGDAVKKKRPVAKKTTKKTVRKVAKRTEAARAAHKRPPSKTDPDGRTAEKLTKKLPKKLPKKLIETSGTVIEGFKSVRFAGVTLGGGKTDKTAVAVLEFYPDQRRVFLRSLRERVSSKEEVTADEALVEILNVEETDLSVIAFDVPLQLPHCFRCQSDCPGAEKCGESEVKWMREMHKKRDKLKRPNKMFTPYTERAAEIYIAHELEEPFHPSQAMGANAAPLTARAHCLTRRLKTPLMEVYPKLSLWRLGCALDIPKSHLRFHKHAVDSDEARLYILKRLIEKEIAFIYQQDMRTMVENNVAFEAFICALTAFLKYRGQTEKRPSGFPKDAMWIDFPRRTIQWF
jgi:hypothetical protein